MEEFYMYYNNGTLNIKHGGFHCILPKETFEILCQKIIENKGFKKYATIDTSILPKNLNLDTLIKNLQDKDFLMKYYLQKELKADV